MTGQTRSHCGNTVSLLQDRSIRSPIRFANLNSRNLWIIAALGFSVSLMPGCANSNGYNGQPCYPYNAYPYAPQQQFGAPGAFQPGGVYPAPTTAAPMAPTPGALVGSPGTVPGGMAPGGMMPGGTVPGASYPTGMTAPPGYNNMPAYNVGPGGGPGQPFIGS